MLIKYNLDKNMDFGKLMILKYIIKMEINLFALFKLNNMLILGFIILLDQLY
jgi:hypothetical protein